MSALPREELVHTIHETIDWAKELSDIWTNTTAGKMIDSEKKQLESALEAEDLELASVLVLSMAQTCINVERLSNAD